MNYNGGYKFQPVPSTLNNLQSYGEPEFMIVGLDNVFDVALNRNVGFIQILYSPEELVEFAVNSYVAHQEHRPYGQYSKYLNAYYQGSDEDKPLFEELIIQLTTQIENNVNKAYERSNVRRPITGYVFKDQMLFIRLG